MVARGALLFIGGLLLLIDDDQAEPRQRREERGARADDHVGGPVEDPPPLVVPLARGERAMEERDAFAESRDEPRDDLRGEGDLRNEDDRAAPAGEGLRREAQVHLGLSAAGDAVQQVAAPGAHPRDDRRDRGGLRRRRRQVLREVRLAQPEFDRHAPHAAGPAQGKAARREARRGGGGAARLGEVGGGDRAGGKGLERRDLPRTELRPFGQRVTARWRDREDRLGPLAPRGRETASRACGERGRKHRADRVGEPAAVGRCHPAPERELAIGKQRDRVDEAVDRLELAIGRYVEPDDDAVDRARAEAGANEVAEADLEPLGDAVGEGARGPAQAGEDGDVSGARGHNS